MIMRVAILLAVISCVDAQVTACSYGSSDCSGDGTCEEIEEGKCENAGEGMGSGKTVCADGKVTTMAYTSDDCSGDVLGEAEMNDGECMDSGFDTSLKVSCPAAPCFARDTSVCLLMDHEVSAARAYSDCFGDTFTGSAKRVHMDQLRGGNVVLS